MSSPVSPTAAHAADANTENNSNNIPAPAPAALLSPSASADSLSPPRPSIDDSFPSDSSLPSSSSSPSLPADPLGPLAIRSIPAGLKVVVHFRATGDAPILKKNKFQLSVALKFSVIIEFLRKNLHSKPGEALFLYCNASFSPSPDAVIYDLYECFQLNNELIINYALQDAWG